MPLKCRATGLSTSLLLTERICSANMKNRDDAQTLTNSISFEFIVTIVVVQYILGLTKPASLESQKGEMDILTTEQEIPTQKHVLEDMQANVNQHHIQLYQKAVQLARKIAIQPSMPRTAQSQMFRDNCSVSSPEDCYRINLTRANFCKCTEPSLFKISSRCLPLF